VSFGPADEGRHAPVADPSWAETWVFDVWRPDGSAGAFTWLTLQPNRRRAWYWSVLARAGEPQLYVADVEVPLPAAGLRVRTTGLWADHTCEAPFEQWTVQNECHAVAFDDPAEAMARGYGEAAPIAIDLEWYATAPPEVIDGGYRQRGEAHAVIELAGGPMELVGPAARAHTWGSGPVALPADGVVEGLHAFLRTESFVVERVLTIDGWESYADR
jgi:hypothetical protein